MKLGSLSKSMRCYGTCVCRTSELTFEHGWTRVSKRQAQTLLRLTTPSYACREESDLDEN